MLNQIYSLAILISFFKCNSVQSIECFECNSKENFYCGKRVTAVIVKKVSCPVQSKCILYKSPLDNYVIHRGCTHGMNLSNIIEINGCFIDDKNSTYCFCDSNQCNAASLIELKNLANHSKILANIEPMRRIMQKTKLKPSLNKTLQRPEIPIVNRKIYKKIFSTTPTTKKIEISTKELKVYQLKINDSISKEIYRKRFNLKPEQKMNILFIKLPIYNNILNENELLKKYLTNNYYTYPFLTKKYSDTITKNPFYFYPLPTNQKQITSTQISEWKLQNAYQKEYSIYFKCPSNGLFPHPTICSKFLQCIDYGTGNERYYVQSCPLGLFFNSFYRYCDYDHNVQCFKTM